MTAITGIAAREAPWHGHEQSRPSGDFARELAKRHAPSHDDAKTSSGDERTGLSEELASDGSKSDAPTELPQAATVDQVRGTSMDPLSAAKQQGRAATQPVGITEALLGARVFGWHALAQSYLSELAAFDGMPGEEMPSTGIKAPVLRSASQAADVAGEESAGAANAPAMAEAPEAYPAAEPVSGIDHAGDPASDIDANRADLVAMASADYWAERSLRFTRQPDGQSVVWLRDYRLDASKADQVVKLVLQDARAKGLALDKIMLNGREAWSSRGQILGGAP